MSLPLLTAFLRVGDTLDKADEVDGRKGRRPSRYDRTEVGVVIPMPACRGFGRSLADRFHPFRVVPPKAIPGKGKGTPAREHTSDCRGKARHRSMGRVGASSSFVSTLGLQSKGGKKQRPFPFRGRTDLHSRNRKQKVVGFVSKGRGIEGGRERRPFRIGRPVRSRPKPPRCACCAGRFPRSPWRRNALGATKGGRR